MSGERAHIFQLWDSESEPQIILGKGSKKKVGNFPLGEGGPENFENFSHFFLFIFRHGLNHPKMQRNFFQSGINGQETNNYQT